MLSIALMSAFSINAASNIINAKDENMQISSVQDQKLEKDKKYFAGPQNLKYTNNEKLKKGVSIGVGVIKIVSTIASIGLPAAAIKCDIKKYDKNFERKSLKQAIKDYEMACPKTKEIFDKLLSAKKSKKLTNSTDHDVLDIIKKKIEDAKKQLNEEIPKEEKSARVKWNGQNLTLEEAYQELAKLTTEASEAEDTSHKIMVANSIHNLIHTLIN